MLTAGEHLGLGVLSGRGTRPESSPGEGVVTEAEEDTARPAHEGLRNQLIQNGIPEWGFQALPERSRGPRAKDRSEDP